MGWYTYDDPEATDDSDEEEYTEETGHADLCFLDFNEEGIIGSFIPHSISQMAGESHASIPSDFRFTRGAKSIEDLSIVWIERVEDDGSDETLASERDILKAVKFFGYGSNKENIDISSPLDVADMPEATLIDRYDAVSTDGSRVSAAILGTTYGPELVTKKGVTVDGDEVEYTVPKTVSALYTATDVYQNAISVPVALADYATVKRGAIAKVEIDVRNDGIEPVTAITVDLGGTKAALTGLSLMPGDAEQCWVDFPVPEDRVTDPVYAVTATFESGATAKTDGKIYLDIPDLMITDAKVMREENGKRDIQICLYNASDAKLEGSRRSVKLSFFSDPTYENPIESIAPVTVSDDMGLRMIDEGGYACQITFDAAAYVCKEGEETAEIPSEGLPVYIRAEVLEENGETEGDINLANNTEAVICENLAARDGQDVVLNGRLETLEDGGSRATVTLQNGHMAAVENGNLIVTLLDEDGNVLEQKQCYDENAENDGLLSLNGEEKQTVTLTFTQQGASAEYSFGDTILDQDVAALKTLTFSNIDFSLDSFTLLSNGKYTADVSVVGLTSTTMTAAAVNRSSSLTIKVNSDPADKYGNEFTGDVTLVPGKNNKITIAVETAGGKQQIYVLTVKNTTLGGSETGLPGDVDGDRRITPEDARLALRRSVELETYAPGSREYVACDADGSNTVTAADARLILRASVGLENLLLFGKWENGEVVYTFRPDGSGEAADVAAETGAPFAYTVNGSTLTIAADGPDSAEAVAFTLRSENVLVLTWQDQRTVTLARVSFE